MIARLTSPAPDFRSKRIRASNGFTLIELMVAVAIIGLILGLGTPIYQRNVIRSHRLEAQSQLVQGAQWMERYYATHDSYVGASLPSSLMNAPISGPVMYSINFCAAPTASLFALCATPSPHAMNARDGSMSLDSQKQKAWDRNNDGVISDDEHRWNE